MSKEQKCLIWHTPAEVVENDFGEGLRGRINSPRTGGYYDVVDAPAVFQGHLNEKTKVNLTNWIVDQHRFGVKFPTLTADIAAWAKSARGLSVFDRADRLLRYLSQKTEKLGEVFKVNDPDSPTGFKEDTDEINCLLAWTASTHFSEVITLFEYINQEKWVEYYCRKTGHMFEGDTKPQSIYYEIMIRPPGYARLSILEGANRDSTQGFIAMWFDQLMRPARDEIKRAISDAGYSPQVIDEKHHNNKICDEIIAEIRRSRFLVADFTSELEKPRGGVYYEAGFAQGLNIPVVWTCRRDLLGQVHFDTNHYNHIVWDEPDDLYKELKNRIEATIGDGPNKSRK